MPEISTLSNGIRVVTENRDYLETACLGLWFDVGSRHEDRATAGIAHCLEHMLFKGTNTRSARDIACTIEAVGGQINAYTTREHTLFYARVMKDDVPLAMDILADMIGESVLDAVELEREKEVILQEIGQCEDTPDEVIFDRLHQASYGDHPLGRSILGDAHTVQGFKAESLRTFLEQNYIADSLVIVAVGAVDHQRICKQAETVFADLKRSRSNRCAVAHYAGGVHHQVGDFEQCHMVFGFEGVSFTSADFYSKHVLSSLLGEGMSSRLFQKIREELGLAYSVYSFCQSHTETGIFGIYAGTSDANALDVARLVKDEIAAVETNLTETEVNTAKAQLKSGLFMSFESVLSRMEQLGRQMLIFGRPLEAQEIIDQIEKVSTAQLQDLSGRFASAANVSLATIGSTEMAGQSIEAVFRQA